MVTDRAHSGTVLDMDTTPTTRKLVKARLLPELHAELVAYAARTHRTHSSAAEHLIALGLRAEGVTPPGEDDVQLR